MPHKKYYVGALSYQRKEIFQVSHTPTEDEYGDLYLYVIGPFRTKLGAEIMMKHGTNNPHIQHVRDAEKLASYGRSSLRKSGFKV